MREQPARAVLALHEYLPPQFTIAVVDETLARDPWAWDLIHDRKAMEELSKRQGKP